MLKLNFLLVLRQLKKDKKSFLVNIIGSSIGFTAVVLMSLYIYYESNYDKFNSNIDQLYRLERTASDNAKSQIFDTTPYELAQEVQTSFPEVVNATSIRNTTNYLTVDNIPYPRETGLFADSSFLEIFTLDFLVGEKKNSLAKPRSIVLTESLANKLFPANDALGNTVTFNKKHDFTVTGVIKDYPKNSHISLDYIISYNSYESMYGMKKERGWNQNYSSTYIQLRKGTDPSILSSKLKNLLASHVTIVDGEKQLLDLRPVTDIYLKSLDVRNEAMAGLRNNIVVIYLFILVAFFTAFVTAVNYVNLTTTQLVNRELEIGMKKVLGISKNQLRAQFILESVLMIVGIILVSAILVVLILPVFSSLVGRDLTLLFDGSFAFFSKVVLITLFLAFLAGLYPVFYLASLKITSFLQGNTSIKRRSYLRKGLVLFQLFVAVPLIFCSYQIISQIEYLNEKDIGFDKENLLTAWISTKTERDEELLEVIKNELAQNPNILSYSVSESAPFFGDGTEKKINWEGSGDNDKIRVTSYAVGYDFLETFKMNLKKGRWFSEAYSTDESAACIINETAAARLGFEDPIGKTIDNGSKRIVGVVEDFNQYSLFLDIPPMMLTLNSERKSYAVVSIRVNPDSRLETMAAVNKIFNANFPDSPIDFRFLDDGFDNSFMTALENVMNIFILFSVISILMIIIGLYSLISFSLQKQKKMIAVRKVLGASTPSLFRLILKEYLILYAIATSVSFMLTFLAYQRISQEFVDGVGLGPLSFLSVIFITFFIVVFTISGKIWGASKESPINALAIE
ncbi:ABC transporter permease [Flavobacteriaceae bacterium M23B6Z8]